MFKLTVKNQTEKVALADIPALRKSFAAASLMIVIGVALAQSIHGAFLILPLLVSVGLMFSALAGWCPMALLMEKYFVKK
jgi:Protein of unknown function (DUF2892)